MFQFEQKLLSVIRHLIEFEQLYVHVNTSVLVIKMLIFQKNKFLFQTLNTFSLLNKLLAENVETLVMKQRWSSINQQINQNIKEK